MPAKTKPITKTELVSTLAEELNMSKKDVNHFFYTLNKIAYKETMEKNCFILPGLAKIMKIKRKSRKGRNPATGDIIEIKPKSVVKFRTAKAFKDAITPPKKNLSQIQKVKISSKKLNKVDFRNSALCLEGWFNPLDDSLLKISNTYQKPIEKIIVVYKKKAFPGVKNSKTFNFPDRTHTKEDDSEMFNHMNIEKKVRFLKERTMRAVHPYLKTIVDLSEEYKIDARFVISFILEENWFENNAKLKYNYKDLAYLNPRFHITSENINIEKFFEKSLGFIRYEFIYYRKKGFDKKSAAICALAAYKIGDAKIRKYIRDGQWDGKSLETIPFKETKGYLMRVFDRYKNHFQTIH